MAAVGMKRPSTIVTVDDFEQTQDLAAWKVLSSTFGGMNQEKHMKQPSVCRQYEWRWGEKEQDALGKLLEADDGMVATVGAEAQLLEQTVVKVRQLREKSTLTDGSDDSTTLGKPKLAQEALRLKHKFPPLLYVDGATTTTTSNNNDLRLSHDELVAIANSAFGAHNMFTIAALRDDKPLVDALLELLRNPAHPTNNYNTTIEESTINAPLSFRGRTFLNTLAWYGHFDLLLSLLKSRVSKVVPNKQAADKNHRLEKSSHLEKILFDLNALDAFGMNVAECVVQGYLCRVHHNTAIAASPHEVRRMAAEDVCRAAHVVSSTSSQVMKGLHVNNNNTRTAEHEALCIETEIVFEVAAAVERLAAIAKKKGAMVGVATNREENDDVNVQEEIDDALLKKKMKRFEVEDPRIVHARRRTQNTVKKVSGVSKSHKRAMTSSALSFKEVIDDDDEVPTLVPALMIGTDCTS